MSEPKNINSYLLKPGEIMLKKANRKHFEELLRRTLQLRLPDARIKIRAGRIYLYTASSHEKVSQRLGSLFGLVAFSRMLAVNKKNDAELSLGVLELVRQNIASSRGFNFKVNIRRTDKSLERNSYDYAVWLGAIILKEFPQLRVNLEQPDWQIYVELREHGYIYTDIERGLGGLPVGCAGRGLVMLSGGIDSPVAAFMLAKRGMSIDAIFFDTPPYTDEQVLKKVQDLSKSIVQFCENINLYIVPFTPLQLHIKQHAPAAFVTIFSRAAMMLISSRLARKISSQCIITGEALSQVASQTVENLHFTGHYAELPVFRPLIGMDKEDIIRLAKQIQTFDISIRPFADCCSLFSPEKPIIKADFAKSAQIFASLQLGDLLASTIGQIRLETIKAEWLSSSTGPHSASLL